MLVAACLHNFGLSFDREEYQEEDDEDQRIETLKRSRMAEEIM